MVTLIGLWVVAYLVGAVPTTHLLAKAVGRVDLRHRGSGNVGASNLAQQIGRSWFPIVAAIEIARGSLPILVGHLVIAPDAMAWGMAATPLLTIVGNNWSPFLRFQGGRGVGVWGGGLMAMSPAIFLAGVTTHLLGWLVTRRSAEWLLVVMMVLPLACYWWPSQWVLINSSPQLAAYAGLGAALIIAKRIEANQLAHPHNGPFASVWFNRLVRDRDIANRALWLSRTRDE